MLFNKFYYKLKGDQQNFIVWQHLKQKYLCPVLNMVVLFFLDQMQKQNMTKTKNYKIQTSSLKTIQEGRVLD